MIFHGSQGDLAIELKTRSQSSVDQVQKCLRFHGATRPGQPLTLVFLTPFSSANEVLGERFTDKAGVRRAVLELAGPAG